jgi:hypothetical protein
MSAYPHLRLASTLPCVLLAKGLVILFQEALHQDIGLFIVAQAEDVTGKCYESVLFVKPDGSSIFFPHPLPHVVGPG